MNKPSLHVILVLLVLLPVLAGPVPAAGYSDPQNRFSLDTPKDWKIRTHEDGIRKAVMEALGGVPSVTILARDVPATETLETQPSQYERIAGSVGADIIVVKMSEESVELAGHPALQRMYAVMGLRGKRARILATFVKVGPLSLTIAATAGKQGFSRNASLVRKSLQTLRFSSSLTKAGRIPPSAEQSASPDEAKRQAIQDVRRKAYQAFHEEMPDRPEGQERLRLSYRVRPGNEFRVHMVMAGRMVAGTPGRDEEAVSENALKYELESVQSVLSADEPGTFRVRFTTRPETVAMLVDGVQQDAGRTVFPDMTVRMTRQGEIFGLDDRARRHGVSADAGRLALMGVRNFFPRFPDREVSIGDRWDLLPSPAENGVEGFVRFIGIQEVQGQRCAVLHVHSRLPMTLPGDLEQGFGREGVRFEGWVETDMTQWFALDMGWPIMGDGQSVYETSLMKDGETVSRTTFHFDVNFEIPL